MSTVNLLEAVQVLNGVLALGVNSLVTAQKIGAVLERAVAESRPISQEEWNLVTADADVADARLAAAIRRLGGQ